MGICDKVTLEVAFPKIDSYATLPEAIFASGKRNEIREVEMIHTSTAHVRGFSYEGVPLSIVVNGAGILPFDRRQFESANSWHISNHSEHSYVSLPSTFVAELAEGRLMPAYSPDFLENCIEDRLYAIVFGRDEAYVYMKNIPSDISRGNFENKMLQAYLGGKEQLKEMVRFNPDWIRHFLTQASPFLDEFGKDDWRTLGMFVSINQSQIDRTRFHVPGNYLKVDKLGLKEVPEYIIEDI